MIDKLGGPRRPTTTTRPAGRSAFSTPYRMFKRYTYQGGVCDPLVIHWPKGIKARGRGARPVPPLDRHRTRRSSTAAASRCPRSSTAYKQSPLAGVSMRYSFDAADAPTQKETQYYEMLGTRGIWHKGWKAVTEHGPIRSGSSNFDQDRWQLFHTDEDRAEAHDLAEEHPEKVEELVDLWFEEAKKYNVLPLNDMQVVARILRVPRDGVQRSRSRRAASTRTTRARPRSPSASAANVHGVSYKVARRGRVHAGCAGRDLRPGLALRRPLAVRQGRQARPTRTTSSASRPRQRIVGDAPDVGQAHRRRRVHEGADGRAPRVATGR